MKDILGREAKVGDLFAYALVVGRSANMAIYELREIKDGKAKAHKLLESYGLGGSMVPAHQSDEYAQWREKYKTSKWVYDPITGKGEYVRLSEEEIAKKAAKEAAKTVTLNMFEERAIILPEGYVKQD